MTTLSRRFIPSEGRTRNLQQPGKAASQSLSNVKIGSVSLRPDIFSNLVGVNLLSRRKTFSLVLIFFSLYCIQLRFARSQSQTAAPSGAQPSTSPGQSASPATPQQEQAPAAAHGPANPLATAPATQTLRLAMLATSTRHARYASGP